MSDKEILEKGHWVTDQIIFAVFKVSRKDSRTRGLEDVIPATKHSFPNPEKFDQFVQVINVRGNHWITLSNIRSHFDGVYIYDSYVSRGGKYSGPWDHWSQKIFYAGRKKKGKEEKGGKKEKKEKERKKKEGKKKNRKKE